MKKRRVLLAALLICFTLSLQEANASSQHLENQDLDNQTYTEYNGSMGGVLYVHDENTHNVTESTLKNNTATSSGGAVYNSATLNVKSSKFEENTASSSSHRGDGGAIYNEGIINIDDSSFTKNKAGEGEDWQEDSKGGAIYNNSKATITNSTFTGNRAKYGGAIYNGAEGNMTVQGTFNNNSAQTGGAIQNNGKLTVKSGSVFEENAATRFGGGAIDNEDATLNIEDNVTFKNNTSLGTDDKKGGAIFSEGEGNSKIQIGKNVTFDGNKSEQGGAIDLYKHNNVTIDDNVTFKNNKASSSGGAISVYTYGWDSASSFTIGNNALFEGNQAGFDSTEGYTPEGFVFGGAIAVSEGLYESENYSTFSIGNNAIFRNNKAIYDDPSVNGYGGALYNAAYNTTVGNNALFDGNISDYGGAVYNQASIEIGQNATFTGNQATVGGAVYNYGDLNLGENAVFDNNTASMGGALYNYLKTEEGSIKKAIFRNNKATFGGALYNGNGTLNIADSVFYNNNASSQTYLNNGGAIYNQSNIKVTNSLFENNTAQDFGGAIYNTKNTSNSENPNSTIDNSQFTNNKAMAGGAVASSGEKAQTTVTNSAFNNNNAIEKVDEDGIPTGGQGGAIWTGANAANTLNVEGSVFENNTAEAEGGAIWSGGKTNITGSLFRGNKTTGTEFSENKPNYSKDREGGGAIFVGSSSQTTIEKSDFINNSSSSVGGAIATRSNASGEASSLTVKGSTFNGNIASKNGGAIASYTDATITDTSFVNNKAGSKGGAIWANGNVSVNAQDSDIIFLGNSAEDGGDIYMDNKSSSGSMGSLTLNAGENKNITITDGISGAEQYNVTVNGAGKVTFNSEIKNANMKVSNGTLHLAEGSSLGDGTTVNVTGATLDSQDGKINDYSGKVFMGQNSKLRFDLSSANKTTDKFSAAEGLSSGTVTVEDFNFLPDTLVSSGNMTLSDIKDSLGFEDEVQLQLPEKSFKTLTPLRYVNVQSGADGISYIPTGNSYRDFNPAVMAAPVAAQVGGYLTQLDSYDEAFRNMDMYMIMPKSMRQAMKFKNKYASSADNWNVIYDNSSTPYENTALWARPYATFENVKLKRGPKVSNVAWGSYIGGDSELFDFGNGWEGMWSLYAGYNGSHQAYNGISIYQNGGTLGLTGTLYKNNFFTGLTANAGANSAESSTNYGDNSFGLFRTGVASKTGYNFEFADGKFIIQPSWLMSYSYVNTENYTTSNGIRINSDPLNVLHLEPGLKFIGNTSNGWQPYAGLSIVWNLLDKTDFTASDATLPELSVKPFFKYGLGLRKIYGERFVGYGQTYLTGGGRNGVGLQFGGRWTI